MRLGVERRQATAMRAGGGRRGGMCLLAGILAAALLAGCDPAPLPDAVLLKPLPTPRCDAKSDAGPRKEAALGATTDVGAEAARLRKLDYEAQCYRHAEMIARHRLGRLQASVQDMVRTAKATPSPTP